MHTMDLFTHLCMFEYSYFPHLLAARSSAGEKLRREMGSPRRKRMTTATVKVTAPPTRNAATSPPAATPAETPPLPL